jgi:hypothetical protein
MLKISHSNLMVYPNICHRNVDNVQSSGNACDPLVSSERGERLSDCLK